MKTRSHTLPLLLTAFLAFGACSRGGSTATSEQGAEVETKEEAIAIALKYLSPQPHAERYLSATAEAGEMNQSWQVTFKHVDWRERRPSVGLISVNKATGEARWLPLR